MQNRVECARRVSKEKNYRAASKVSHTFCIYYYPRIRGTILLLLEGIIWMEIGWANKGAKISQITRRHERSRGTFENIIVSGPLCVLSRRFNFLLGSIDNPDRTVAKKND